MVAPENRASSARVGGVIIDTGASLRFVPAENALAVLDNPRLSAVPGTALDMLWFEGRVIAAATWARLTRAAEAPDETPSTHRVTPPPGGAPSRKPASALVCEIGGQLLALVGVVSVATGLFEVTPSGAVRFDDQDVPPVDLGALQRAALSQSRGRDESRDGAAVPSDSRGDDLAEERHE